MEEEEKAMYEGGSRRREECRRKEEEDGAFSRGGIAEEVQTRFHLHNRYIPAAWTGVEAESSVSSVRYIARLVLMRWQSLRIFRGREGRKEEGRWKIRKETEKTKVRLEMKEAAVLSLSTRCACNGEGAHAVPEETGEKREKRRREYSTTDDIIRALCLSRVILLAEVLFSFPLFPRISFPFSTFRARFFPYSFRPLSNSRGIQDPRKPDVRPNYIDVFLGYRITTRS